MTFRCWFPVRGRNTQCHTMYFEVHIAPQSFTVKIVKGLKAMSMIEVTEKVGS